MAKESSAGILVYRFNKELNQFEFLLCYPGGKFYYNLDDDGNELSKKPETNKWGIPKGKMEPDESVIDTAIREFTEETGLSSLGQLINGKEVNLIELSPVKYNSGKTIYAYAVELDLDVSTMHSNTFTDNYKGKEIQAREVSDYRYFTLRDAEEKCHLMQYNFLVELYDIVRIKNHRLNIIYPNRDRACELPYGEYCYERDNSLKQQFTDDGIPLMKIKICKHWAFSKNELSQNCGYCSKINEADWDENSSGLLWDHVKQCGISMTDEKDLG